MNFFNAKFHTYNSELISGIDHKKTLPVRGRVKVDYFFLLNLNVLHSRIEACDKVKASKEHS